MNVDKTKIMIFSRGRQPQNIFFSLNGLELEVVNSFTYLGFILSKTGNFNLAKKSIADKGFKAMYEVLKLGRLHNLTTPCQLDLFDKMFKPVLLYGCELFGYGNCDIIKRVHLKFCKMLLHMKSSTPSFMVYGELGRYPLAIDIKIRIVSYWEECIDGKQSNLSNILYELCLALSNIEGNNFIWLSSVKGILKECGLAYIWNTQTFQNTEWLKANPDRSIHIALVIFNSKFTKSS